MPTPVFEFDLKPNTNAPMQDLACDPWTWEVFCGQFTGGMIYPPRQTAVLTHCAPPDNTSQCNEVSVMKLLDAGHGHMIGFQRETVRAIRNGDGGLPFWFGSLCLGGALILIARLRSRGKSGSLSV